MLDGLAVISFESARHWLEWLEENHANSKGIWLRIFNKGSGEASVFYPEALDEALCFGWIDGQKKPYDDESWLQKFTHRRPRSIWSKNNTRHVERLIQAGKMRPAGLDEVAAAKNDGRWQIAYERPRDATLPEDFIDELAKDQKAKAFFETLSQRNTFAISRRLQSAKRPETRERRMKAILEMLSQGEKPFG